MSPRVDPADRRNEILDAAMRCFSRTGYNGTSMNDVVQESGLSKGTLYWHFTNKKDLFLAAFDRVIATMIAELERAQHEANPVDEALPPADQLRQLFELTMDALSHSDLFTAVPINFLTELWQEEGFMDHYRSAMTPYAEMLTGLIEAGITAGDFRPVDATAAAWGIMAALDGVIIYIVAGLPDTSTASGKALSDLLIAGLLHKKIV